MAKTRFPQIDGYYQGLGICFILGLALVGATHASSLASEVFSPPKAYVGRLDPATGNIYTFTLPAGSGPTGVDVYSGTTNIEVWFTETSVDRIGRLTYTSTAECNLKEYPLSPGSAPLNIAISRDSKYVFFTEQNGNKIGRLTRASPAESLVEFPIPTANSMPTDLDIAPNGNIWFTEKAVDKLGRLSITDYTFTEYEVFPGSKPHGIAAPLNGAVWFAEIATNRASLFELYPQGNILVRISPCAPYDCTDGNRCLHDVAVLPGSSNVCWLTAMCKNRLVGISLGTLSIARECTPTVGTVPFDLAMDKSGRYIWFTAWGSGHIGRLERLSPNCSFTEYFIAENAGPRGIALDPNGVVWFTCSERLSTYLPIIMKNY